MKPETLEDDKLYRILKGLGLMPLFRQVVGVATARFLRALPGLTEELEAARFARREARAREHARKFSVIARGGL